MLFINAHSTLSGDPFQDSLQSVSVVFLPDILFFLSFLGDGIYPSGFYGDNKRSWLRDEYPLSSNILSLSIRKGVKGTGVWVEGG